MVKAMFGRRFSVPLVAGCLVANLALSTPALAHFVWIRSEFAGQELLVEAGFGDPQGWDAEYSDSIAGTKYFVRTGAGKEEPIELVFNKEAQAYVARAAYSGPAAVLGICEYGTFSFGGKPSLLRYYAKRLTGSPETWVKLAGSEKLAIEAVPALIGTEIEVTVMASGKPVPNADLKIYGPKSKGVAAKTDSDGKVRWTTEGAGDYSLYVGRKLDGKGEHEGKAYDGVREYATLTFTLTAADLSPSAKR